MSDQPIGAGAVLGGTYRLERELGTGGMGTVYEATHLRVPRRFAVKLLNREVVHNREVFDRFRREAEIASALGDEHIVQVFDFNYTDDGAPYMVLELLEGEDLAQRLARFGQFSLEQTVRLLEQLTSALEAAHAAGIVHRDLKPQNIFLCRRGSRDDFVKVLDFGISKIIHGPSTATRTGMVFGTPNYMSPEQAEGRTTDIDQRTDLFALGAILYECLTGRIAFEAPTVVGTIYKVCHHTPEAIHTIKPGLPASIEQVIVRALAKKADERYQTAADLRNDFIVASGFERRSTIFATPAPQPATTGPYTVVEKPTTFHTAAGEVDGIRTLWRPAPVAIGVVLLAGLALGTWVIAGRKGGEEGTTTSATTSTTTSTSTTTNAEPSPPPPEVVPVPAPTIAPTPPAPPRAEVAAPSPEIVAIGLRVTPESAIVELNGLPTASNPLRLVKGTKHKLVFRAPGFVTVEREIQAKVDTSLLISLDRLRPASGRIRTPARPAAPPSVPVVDRPQKIKVKGPMEEDL